MKSIKQQYIDLQEGNMSQANFMRNIRMTLPHLVTNVTSFEDSVRILRNKGILTEADIAISKDTLNKVKKVISDLTAKNDDYHRDGYTMGFFEGNNPESDDDIPAIYRMYNSDAWVDAQKDAGGGDYDDEDMDKEDERDDYDTDYEEPNEPFDMAESLTEAKDNSSEGKWKTVTGKDLYAHFKELDNLNGHEVVQGIDWEMQCNPELPKKDIIKKVIKNLKKNPIYYTSWDMSGVEGYEPETMGPKADIEARQMQYLDKNMGNVVDKKMGMKPVKDVEKVKKDADAKKETNTPEKGISLMSLIAKSVRGLKKMDATGEKMKKISIKEGEYTTNWEFNESEKKTIRDLLNDNETDFDVETEPGQTTKTTVSSAKNADKNVKHAVQQARGEIKNTHSSAGEGVAKFLTKERLKEIIRQEIAGAYGGDAMDAEDGSSYTKEQ
jgi:hypothetical protein